MPQRNTIASSPVKAWTIIRWRYTSPGSLTHITHLTNTSFFFAGLDENHINGIYFNGKGDSHRMSFEDETLYWLIRNGYRTEEHIDKNAYEHYQDLLDRRAQRLAAQCASPSRTDILTGYEVVQFYQKEVLTDESGSYTVYCWEPAFLTDSPDDIPWAGGMYLDADGRLCAYE